MDVEGTTTTPSLMRPRKQSGMYERKSPMFVERRRYYSDNDEEIEETASHARAAVGTVLCIIIVVAIVLFIIWFCMTKKNPNDIFAGISFPKKPDGTVLIAEGGKCTNTNDCRNGLVCFEGQCRSPLIVARVKAAALATEAKQQNNTQTKPNPTEPFTITLEFPTKKDEEETEAHKMAHALKEARQDGIYETLRRSSAVSNADMDLSY